MKVLKIFLLGLIFLSIIGCSDDDDNDSDTDSHGDLTQYVGKWDGDLIFTFPDLGTDSWDFWVDVKADGTVNGQLKMTMLVNHYPVDFFLDMSGECWAEKPPWHFYAEFTDNSGDLVEVDTAYMGGSIVDGKLCGWYSEDKELTDPPDNTMTFILEKVK